MFQRPKSTAEPVTVAATPVSRGQCATFGFNIHLHHLYTINGQFVVGCFVVETILIIYSSYLTWFLLQKLITMTFIVIIIALLTFQSLRMEHKVNEKPQLMYVFQVLVKPWLTAYFFFCIK